MQDEGRGSGVNDAGVMLQRFFKAMGLQHAQWIVGALKRHDLTHMGPDLVMTVPGLFKGEHVMAIVVICLRSEHHCIECYLRCSWTRISPASKTGLCSSFTHPDSAHPLPYWQSAHS